MFEHVGESRLPEYFQRAWKLLRPGGAFLNHGIAKMLTGSPIRGPSFSEGFEVRDVESLREHYALTLRQWIRRLEAHHEEARRATDETTYRVWRLFMSASAYQFSSNETNVYQSLLVKADGGKSGLPLTRGDWYG
jgi:cyclopropane-fatty-acyl-phospholipid synthase